MSQPKQTQQPAAIAGNGNPEVDSDTQVARKQPKPVVPMKPTTYIDPAADVVLRPRGGSRDFRVHSWMLKANW